MPFEIKKYRSDLLNEGRLSIQRVKRIKCKGLCGWLTSQQKFT